MPRDSVFSFSGYRRGSDAGSFLFDYALEHKGEKFAFCESLHFPGLEELADRISGERLKPFLQSIHLALGISYWKLFYPDTIQVPGFSLTGEMAAFWDTVYTKGLSEFFYRNAIDFRDLIRFPHAAAAAHEPQSLSLKNRSLLFVGGGKDSIVSGELLKKGEKEFASFTLGNSPVQEGTAERLGSPHIVVERRIDPQLFELNKRPDAANGHIPISMIYAFIGIIAAAIYDYRYVIASNEESSNYGNVRYLGEEVNHQWSKSLEFETLFRDYVQKNVAEGIEYFSLLRPLTELEIVRRFSDYREYFFAFSSCNRNFKLSGAPKTRWCGECPKCAFVFLLLAAHLPKESTLAIFNKNLFQDEHLLGLYQQLLGIKDVKPFECVGTPEETAAAFYMVNARSAYRESPALTLFQELMLSKRSEAEWQQLLSDVSGHSTHHYIPPEFQSLL
jgi:hypothetical protein